MNYVKINRNTLSNFLKSREHYVHVSVQVTTPTLKYPKGLIHRPGITYKNNIT